MKIGLLMTRDEEDILADTLEVNCQHVDCFYALDGSADYGTAFTTCTATGKCRGFTRDDELPDHYPDVTTDGCRQFLYEQATRDHGYNHWFLLLHGDEAWTFEPEAALELAPKADGFEFRLPFLFPRDWDYDRSAFDQLHEAILPGWPEFRMFWGSPEVSFDPQQHFSTTPRGLKNVARIDWPIMHYLYRSPEQQRRKAQTSISWSPENFEAVRNREDAVFWDDYRIASFIEGNQHYNRVVDIASL